MNLHAIYHKPKSNYCYPYDENTIHIRIRVAKSEAEEIILIYGDKYEWDNKKEISMRLLCSDSLYDYFGTEIEPPNNRLAYYFIIKDYKEEYVYTEWGPSREIDEQEIYLHFFQYPYLNNIDIHKVPEWVKDAVFYQIFPERFFNGDSSNDPKNIEPWGQLPTYKSFYGGDIQGIIEKLDYLENLGINAIYLTPVFQSPTNHKYDTIDYFKVDPAFGDLSTLKELVKKCHQRGIKVVLDAVFNHSGYLFKPFQDVIEKGEKSPYYSWFHINKWPIEINPPSYDTFAFVPNMPKLNTENQEVREYLLEVGRYWIKEADIDGWRLDVANEIDHSFWRDFRKVVKEAKEDAYIVGEIWHDSLPWLMGDQFDAIMNYPFMRVCIEYFANNSISDSNFIELINEIQMRNTKQVNEVMLDLLDSHDTPRFLTRCEGNLDKLKLAAIFKLTYLGAPSIYYGTEIGMEGGGDPDCRRTMEWDSDKWNVELFEFYKKLINLRISSKALRRGSFRWIERTKDIVGYVREFDQERVIILINNNNMEKNIELPKGSSLKDAVSGEIISCNQEKNLVKIPQRSARILVEKMK